MKELPTTDHEIAIGNLQSQIDAAERRLAQAPQTVPAMKTLIGLYAMRAQFLGQLADYDRALDLGERLVKQAPTDPDAYAARAGARSSLHLFKEALADLDEAEHQGARNDVLAGARAGIYQALGRYDDAYAIRERKAREWPTTASLGALATLEVAKHDNEAAERLFVEAQDKFSDVSPFPLAWLYMQQGLMWEDAGDFARAHDLFGAARERLPEYAPATGHLASVEELMPGGHERAIALLRPLVDRSDDPEYAGQLSTLLAADPATRAEADALRARAASRYAALLAAHPAAFADHAARFWLGAGADAKQALELAQKNLAQRQTAEAYVLVIDAALAAGQPSQACGVTARALALPYPSQALRDDAARAAKACGD
jgi:hypothetical protein